MSREKINLNICVSALVVHGREVKLHSPKCEVFIDVMQCESLTDVIQEEEPIKGFIEIEVRDSKGKVIKKGKHEMRSFLNNLLKVLEGFMRAYDATTTSTTVIAPDGTSKTVYVEWRAGTNYYGGGTPMATQAGDNDASYGIIVGSGTTPVDLGQYSLATPIPHGTGAGQLDYDATAVNDLGLDTSVSPPIYRFRIVRTFKNLSGGNININEVGLVARSYWKDGGGVRQDIKYLIARDVLTTTYTVPDEGSATVAITVEVVLG